MAILGCLALVFVIFVSKALHCCLASTPPPHPTQSATPGLAQEWNRRYVCVYIVHFWVKSGGLPHMFIFFTSQPPLLQPHPYGAPSLTASPRAVPQCFRLQPAHSDSHTT